MAGGGGGVGNLFTSTLATPCAGRLRLLTNSDHDCDVFDVPCNRCAIALGRLNSDGRMACWCSSPRAVPTHCVQVFVEPRAVFPSAKEVYGLKEELVCWLVGCLTSQQQASVSQGRICSDNFTCCHTETEVADPNVLPHPVTVY